MPWLPSGVFVPQTPLVQTPSPAKPQPIVVLGQPSPPLPANIPSAGQTPIDPSNKAGLADLTDLVGTWEGEGFNMIWRPNNSPASDHFLQLNFTNELLSFHPIKGDIPNRGLLQADIAMSGLQYFQEVTDASSGDTLHIEPGIWLSVPPTKNPTENATYVRMGSIPHGTTVHMQGFSRISQDSFPPVDITPFAIANPQNKIAMPTSNLGVNSPFRSPLPAGKTITQDELNDLSLLLKNVTNSQQIVSATTFELSTSSAPVMGGGVANTAFLIGCPAPNALVKESTLVMKLQRLKDTTIQLQYLQIVFLDFATLRWPHISVGTLRKLNIDPFPQN